jgi:hypothetical protein
VQEIGKAVSERRKITANTSEEQELMKELNTNVLNLSMKKSIEASDFENGGQRVFVTNAMDIGVGMAAVMNNLNQGIGGTVVGSSVKPNGQ